MERGDNVHDHSLESFDALPKNNRADLIYRLFKRVNRPLTDRQVKDALGFDEMNAVRPRITEMSKECDGRPGLLEECGQTRDYKSGKTVRQTRISRPSSAAAFSFQDMA